MSKCIRSINRSHLDVGSGRSLSSDARVYLDQRKPLSFPPRFRRDGPLKSHRGFREANCCGTLGPARAHVRARAAALRRVVLPNYPNNGRRSGGGGKGRIRDQRGARTEAGMGGGGGTFLQESGSLLCLWVSLAGGGGAAPRATMALD